MQLIFVIQDKEVYVDGVNRLGDYTLPEGLKGEVHSIVWANTQKEYNTVVNGKMHCVPLMKEDYETFIVPLSEQWQEFERQANLSQAQRIKEGIEDCPAGTKIVNDEVVAMTLEEQLKAGVIDSVQFEQLKRSEIIEKIRGIENTDEYKRKVRLAMTGDETAKKWLVEKEKEIQVLREKLITTEKN